MLKSYEYRLYPNKEQRVLLAKHFGCNRFIYNWALAKRIEAYKKTGKTISKYELDKMITQLKKDEKTAWLSEVNAQSLQQSVQNMETAYINFFRNKKGFPKFKSKKSHRYSYRIPQNNRIDFERSMIFLPKIGEVKIRVDRVFMDKISSVTVKQVPSGKYFVSVLVEDNIPVPDKYELNETRAVGIDLGLKDFAILSTGERVSNPKTLSKNLVRLTVLQKRLSRKEKGSRNRDKSRIRVAKQHEKISNIRKDFLHKLSTKIVSDNQVDVICLETLNVSGLLKNHKLARSISDVGWSTFVQMLEYKTERAGKVLLRIGQFEPSSRLCTCGYINRELTLADREWTCPICQVHHDRDILAANNIKRIAFSDINQKYYKTGLGKPGGLVEVRRQAADEARNVSEIRET